MSVALTRRRIVHTDDVAVALKRAITEGDVDALAHMLASDPGLAVATIASPHSSGDSSGGGEGVRSLLHVATDWPGHFPRVVETIALLVHAGAEVNGRFDGAAIHTETPLHWAASSDDVDALSALLDHGADIEANGAVVGGGTALGDAVAFGNWKSARALVARGARMNLWQAAALGDLAQTHALLERAEHHDVTNAFWSACHGGQRAAAEILLAAGADPAWVGHDQLDAAQAARRSGFVDVADWAASLTSRRE